MNSEIAKVIRSIIKYLQWNIFSTGSTEGKCLLPAPTPDKIYTINDCVPNSSDPFCQKKPGEYVDAGVVLNFQCKTQMNLAPVTDSFSSYCLDGQWLPEIESCKCKQKFFIFYIGICILEIGKIIRSFGKQIRPKTGLETGADWWNEIAQGKISKFHFWKFVDFIRRGGHVPG